MVQLTKPTLFERQKILICSTGQKWLKKEGGKNEKRRERRQNFSLHWYMLQSWLIKYTLDYKVILTDPQILFSSHAPVFYIK